MKKKKEKDLKTIENTVMIWRKMNKNYYNKKLISYNKTSQNINNQMMRKKMKTTTKKVIIKMKMKTIIKMMIKKKMMMMRKKKKIVRKLKISMT